MRVSAVLIAPVALEAEADELTTALGWSSGNLAVRLSSSGEEPATHLGCHVWASQLFRDQLTGAAPLPDEAAARPELLAALVASFRDEAETMGHVQAVLEAEGLRPIPEEDA